VLEAGTHSPWLSRVLAAAGHEVVVAQARQVRLIYQSPRKSDRVDAETLARLGRLDPALLAPIQHRGADAQQHLALLRSRDAVVRTRTLLINHLRGVEQLAQAQYPETARLRQVKGVGALTALAYVLTLESPARFPRSRQVGPYLGLCPRRAQSSAHDPELRISKTGDPLLRRLLVTSAHYILGPFGPETALRAWGLRLAQGGKRAKKRAVVAVARKLAVLLHQLWRSGAPYQPGSRSA
jgi:transposase